MNWGKWIAVSFVLFAIFIGVLVTVCIRQDINLVATDYYKQELDYQNQIDRNRNAQELVVKPQIKIANNAVQVSFNDFNRVESGELKLFRPSNPAYDVTFELKPTADTLQAFDLQTRQRGMYKAQLKWSMNNKEYYLEETVYL
jgi:hypothetical protein